MPTVPSDPPERYLPLEEADGERISGVGSISTFGDEGSPRERAFPFGFGLPQAPNRPAQNRHRGSVARRA